MTLLSVINEVCDIVSLDRFESIYGSNDPNAETMVALAQEAGEEIARRSDWRRLLKQQVAIISPMTLPADYQRMTPGGAVRTASGTCFRPIANSSQWAIVDGTASAQPYFFLRASQILFSPAAAGVGAVVDYVSKNWVLGDPYEERDTLKADDDGTVFPERLLCKGILWRWKRQKGLPYDDSLAEFEADLLQEINADRGVS
ncbi:phage adaptor protein [Ensifer sp. MJa1]|uniref:phage adaptor protein n=1 Tax=Ensifer sp. MJa1 TaxID=2919888 RepID=UPI00300990A1